MRVLILATLGTALACVGLATMIAAWGGWRSFTGGAAPADLATVGGLLWTGGVVMVTVAVGDAWRNTP